MDFSFSDEQQLLADSARRYLQDRYSFEARRRILASSQGCSREVWTDFAELGLLGLHVPESDGGLGGGAVDTLVIGAALGEALVVEPYLESAVVATRAIAELGSPAQRAAWLPALAAGRTVAVLAHGEVGSDASVRATADGANWRLDGRLPVVYHAPAADLLLVAAHTSTAAGSPDALFAIPAPSVDGVELTACTTVDGQVAADIEFRGAVIPGVARVGADATAALEAVVDHGTMALCAEAIGALDRSLALTVDYTRTRQQFGGPIGRFQVLQHRMVDMLTRIEQARSLVYLAASACQGPDPVARECAVSAAKVLVCDAARWVGQQAVQLHGGMGVTDEMSISHYFRRLLATEFRLGAGDAHLGRYARRLSAG